MPDCPLNSSDSPCEHELDLMILRETERESLESFYAMREELHFYLKRTQLLETILTENASLFPPTMTDPTLCQPLRLAEPITGGPFRRGDEFSSATWRKFSVQLAGLIRYMHFKV